jgi:hypothetical protein
MFRFTIRDVLWLTVVVALGVGWWLQFKKAEAAIEMVEGAKEQAEVMSRVAQADAARHSEEMWRFRKYVELLTAKLEEKGYRPRFRDTGTRNGTPHIILFDEGARREEEDTRK